MAALALVRGRKITHWYGVEWLKLAGAPGVSPMPSVAVGRNCHRTGPAAPRCRVRPLVVPVELPNSMALQPELLVLLLAGAANPPATPVELLKSPPVEDGPVKEGLLMRSRPGLLPARRTPPLR